MLKLSDPALAAAPMCRSVFTRFWLAREPLSLKWTAIALLGLVSFKVVETD